MQAVNRKSIVDSLGTWNNRQTVKPSNRQTALCIVHCALCILLALPLHAQQPTLPPYSLFAMPALHPVHKQLVARFKEALAAKDYKAMLEISAKAVEVLPEDATWRYNLACSLAREGKPREALKELEKAVRLGFTDDALIASDADLATLRRDADFARILSEEAPAVDLSDTKPVVLDPESGRFKDLQFGSNYDK